MNSINKDILIEPEGTIIEALKKLDKTAEKTLLVVDNEGHLLGTLTDGDIRRYIIKTGDLSGTIKSIYNRNPVSVRKDKVSEDEIKKTFLRKKIELIPLVDDYGKVVGYITWTQVFSGDYEDFKYAKEKLEVPVVIMAGGKGTRLSPFTYILPKPLIPIGKKTMVEHIIDNFLKFGVKKFFMTLNYKGELIEAYFNGINKNYEIEFIWEEDFLGTAGSLKLLKDKLEGDFIVSNCDIIVRANFFDALNFHRKNRADFTSITAIQHYKIPYGVVNVSSNGIVNGITEKPEYTFQINTGVYILNKSVLEYIPENEYFDMPELIKRLISDNKKVIAYPVNEGDYIDMGQWEEYKEAIKKLEINNG